MSEQRHTPIERLRRRAEFLRVAAGRRRCARPGLVLQVLTRSDGDAAARVGFTVSRKVGNAVARNRARRRLRAAVKEVMPMHAEPGHDYVVIGRRETLTRPFPALRDDLAAAMRRLRAFRGAAQETTS